MNFFELLFSFQGRIGRLTWWLMGLVQMVILLLTFAPIAIAVQAWADGRGIGAAKGAGSELLLLVGMGVGLIAMMWVGLAATVKRFHDRDKSGWWMLISLVPVIGNIWLLIELGMLGPVDAGNRFGPPPGSGHDADGASRLDADDVIAAWRNRAPEPSPAMAVATASGSRSGVSAWNGGHSPVVARTSNPGGGFGRRGRV